MDDAASTAQREIWGLGHYPSIAQHLMPIAVAAVDAAGVQRATGCSMSGPAPAMRRWRPPGGGPW